MGGKSSEHDVSLHSGEEVFANIDRDKFTPVKLLINRDGSFEFTLDELKSVDVVFIALHGAAGENGSIQGFLDVLGMKYTGAGVLASAIGMDKYLSKELWKAHKLPIVPHRLIRKLTDCAGQKFPYVLKPRAEGSSVGVKIIRTKKELTRYFNENTYNEYLLEDYIQGRELTVGVLRSPDGQLVSLPTVEIRPNVEFYDYDAKYLRDDTKYEIPARLPEQLESHVKEMALRAANIIGVDSFARVDILLDGDKPYLLEVNTIPGLTSHSLLPKAAEVAGISFRDLITRMLG